MFQGKSDIAERLFDEAASIDVPDRTSSVNEPAQARKAFKNGRKSQAFRILRSYIQKLLETDYTDLAKLAAVEFINMMVAIDRLPEAARIMGYLAATGDFGTIAVRALVTDASRTLEARAEKTPGMTSTHQNDMAGQEALRYMDDVLGDLGRAATRVAGSAPRSLPMIGCAR